MTIFLRKEKNETASNPMRVIVRGENKQPGVVSDQKSVTMGELQTAPMPSWMADDCLGFEFCATLQLRTPLRVLLRHGELYLKNDGRQPHIAHEPWEGIWLPKTKTYKELGLDIPEPPPGTHASDIGPTLPEDYMPFLIAVRKIVEADDTIEHRIQKLRDMPIEPEWQAFVSKHGGIDGIVERFFPKLMNLGDGLDTPNRIAAASDETLLGIKGIGPAKLKAIRARCALITEDRDSARIANVIR